MSAVAKGGRKLSACLEPGILSRMPHRIHDTGEGAWQAPTQQRDMRIKLECVIGPK